MSDIVGGLRLIDQTTLPADTRLQMERIHTAAEALARLLEEGLSFPPGEDGTANRRQRLSNPRLLPPGKDGTPSGAVGIMPLARAMPVQPGVDALIGLTPAEIERLVIEDAIARHGGSIPRAARELDVSPSTLYRKLESWQKARDYITPSSGIPSAAPVP